MKHTVGYYDDSRSRGGTTRYLAELIQYLDRTRFDPVFFALQPHEWHKDVRNLGVEIVTLLAGAPEVLPRKSLSVPYEVSAKVTPRSRLPLPAPLAWSAGLARDTANLIRLFRMRSVDLLHLNNTGAEPAPVAARMAGMSRVIGTWHVCPSVDIYRQRQSARYKLLERSSMHSLHHAIAVSEATRDEWIERCGLSQSFRRSRITVVHNGIDTRRVERRISRDEAKNTFHIAPEALVIGSVGRLDPVKGYEYLINALPVIVQRQPQTLLLLAGAGSHQSSLEKLADELGMADRVRFLGFVSDVRRVLECLDIYVQPSLSEALPIGIIEAQGMGLPVVASNVGGVAEVVADGVTGYVVPPKNPDALAEALTSLLRDPEKREEMGRFGQAKILAGFTQEQMAAKTVAVYEHVLARNPVRFGRTRQCPGTS